MLACRRPLARCHGGLRIFRGLTTSTTTIHSALEEAANTVAREPLLARLRSTFHPWPDVAAVVAPRELHYQVQSFAGTTGTVGALLSSVIGAALLADPPSYSADANQKHQAKEKHKLERPLLARLMGWRLEMSDVTVEPLYPPEMASLSVDEFLAALPSLDAPFAAKCAAAAEAGEVLRYAAAIADGALKVSLVSVSADTPLGRLAGTDNLVEVYTQWYEKPLVIQGAGAGVGTTAAGVLADMVELAFTK